LSDFEKSQKEGAPLPLRAALLDEAHRIIPAQQAGGDERLVSAAKEASELFRKMIAECRALNLSLIVGEQSASQIDPNVLINTATKIVHGVLYGKDKEFLSAALSLSPQEQDTLAFLKQDESLTFLTNAYQPLILQMKKWEPTKPVAEDEWSEPR
jgi:DNA helicase HerA-like ATPase